jgi:hypothetical protein
MEGSELGEIGSANRVVRARITFGVLKKSVIIGDIKATGIF